MHAGGPVHVSAADETPIVVKNPQGIMLTPSTVSQH